MFIESLARLNYYVKVFNAAHDARCLRCVGFMLSCAAGTCHRVDHCSATDAAASNLVHGNSHSNSIGRASVCVCVAT